MNKRGYVYLLTNKKHGTLYTGATTNLISRIHAHRNKVVKGFAAKYNLTRLVYFEVYEDLENAFKREKRLKNWNRKWKIELIEESNPNWDDLFFSIL